MADYHTMPIADTPALKAINSNRQGTKLPPITMQEYYALQKEWTKPGGMIEIARHADRAEAEWLGFLGGFLLALTLTALGLAIHLLA